MAQWQVRTRYLFLFILGFGVILISRLYGLSFKPIHHDEAVNIWWVSEIWSGGYFPYDPTNYHGPLLFYLFQFLEILDLESLSHYRGLTSLFNVATIVLVLWWGFKTSRRHWVAVGLLIALSPAMIFFSRSAIHESLFVFFQIMTFLGLVEFFTSKENPRRRLGIKLAIWGLVGASLLKETFVLPLFSGIVAFVYLWILQSKEKKYLDDELKAELKKQLALGLLVWALFYSALFAHPAGLLDFFKAFLPWASTGTQGMGHEKPFMYWIDLMFKHEPMAFVLFILSLMSFATKSRFAKVLSIFSLLHLLIYSVIPYKTPWCLISILWPIYFSGIEVARVVMKSMPKKVSYALMTGFAGLGLLQAKESVAINYVKPINHSHDYVYVQTTEEAQKVFDKLQMFAAITPEIRSQPILLYMEDPWPLPTVLRGYHKVYSVTPSANIAEQDFSNLPNDFGVIVMTADSEKQDLLFEKFGQLKSEPCDVRFHEALDGCHFRIREGGEEYQLILTQKVEHL